MQVKRSMKVVGVGLDELVFEFLPAVPNVRGML